MQFRLVGLLVRPNGIPEKRWYAREVVTGRSTLPMIAASISTKTTLTQADIIATLNALLEDITQRLQQGQIVELGELGNFQLVIHNKGGSLSEKSWTFNLIKGAYVRHRATKLIKAVTDNVTYTRWKDLDLEAAKRMLRDAESRVAAGEEKLVALLSDIKILESAAQQAPLSRKDVAELAKNHAEVTLLEITLEELRKEALRAAKAYAKSRNNPDEWDDFEGIPDSCEPKGPIGSDDLHHFSDALSYEEESEESSEESPKDVSTSQVDAPPVQPSSEEESGTSGNTSDKK